MAPVRLTEAEGHLVVVEQISVPGQAHEWILMPGDVVLGVNGADINEIVAEMLQYVSYPNEDKALFFLNHSYIILRQYSPDEPMILDIYRDGILKRVEIQPISILHQMELFFEPQSDVAYRRLENNIGLINSLSLGVNCVRNMMQYFSDTDGLIVDLRGPSFVFLADYFVETAKLVTRVTVPSQSIPGVFVDFARLYAGGGRFSSYAFFYENNVVVLMDEHAASSPETATMALRNGANVTVMGSNSLGANGNIRRLPLPGGITMYFSNVGMFTPEGGQTQRIGLEPDIHVPRTIAGIRDGRDELFDAAIQFLLTGSPS